MIEVERLSKRYGEFVAVDELDFTVPDGAITGFLGPNGAGKSTAMRCMLGLGRPTAGPALIDGLPLAGHARPATAAGAVLDTSWFHPGRTGLAHLKIAAASSRLPLRRAEEALEAVGMSSVAHRNIGKYSLGMKQRLGIATAMLGRPRNIILDEPMNGLDPQGMEWMRTYLREAAAKGHAVLVSSHLLTEMETLADRLLVIGRGRLVGDRRTSDFLNARDREAAISTDDDTRLEMRLRCLGASVRRLPDGLGVTFDEAVPDATALSRICMDLGVLITALGNRPARLEEMFLELTAESSEYRTGGNRP